MKKAEKIFRIIHIILCFANIGSLFFGIMRFSGSGNKAYSFFRELSIELCFPMLLMRTIYLQYVLWGIIALFTIINVIYKIRTKSIAKKFVFIDCTFWITAIFELIYLESYFSAISHF